MINILVFSLAASLSYGMPSDIARRCGVRDLNVTEFMEHENHRHFKLSKIGNLKATNGGTVNVHFHVITDSNGNGGISRGVQDTQIDVLNSAYAKGNWNFVWKSSDTTANDKWYTMTPGSPAEKDCKTSLRAGGSSDLNLYSAHIGQGLLGWATFPSDYEKDPEMDGVVILNDAFPGGSSTHYDLGATAVHETGHWLGLFHTFQGGCMEFGGGDGVEDTPAEKQANYGCPGVVDSCPKEPGNDPTDNYMDYVYDECMTQFTSGQFSRIVDEFSAYRAGF